MYKTQPTVAVCICVHARAVCGSLWNCTCQSILWQFVELYMSKHTVAVCDEWKMIVNAYCSSL